MGAKPKVFIDGEAGTTGLQVRDRLAKRDDLDIISAPNELRKDEATRKNLINEADAVILCLPDAASIEAVSWVEPDNDPGCYPTGFIGLTRPLVDAGILPEGTAVTVNAISGYSGGGKDLMNLFENENPEPWGTYGLSLKHKRSR